MRFTIVAALAALAYAQNDAADALGDAADAVGDAVDNAIAELTPERKEFRRCIWQFEASSRAGSWQELLFRFLGRPNHLNAHHAPFGRRT